MGCPQPNTQAYKSFEKPTPHAPKIQTFSIYCPIPHTLTEIFLNTIDITCLLFGYLHGCFSIRLIFTGRTYQVQFTFIHVCMSWLWWERKEPWLISVDIFTGWTVPSSVETVWACRSHWQLCLLLQRPSTKLPMVLDTSKNLVKH